MAKQKEKPVLPPNAFDEVILGWVAPEYLRFERGWLWFVLMFAVSGLLVWYAYSTDSLTMMAVFAILPLILILEHRKKPKMVEVIFSPYGMKFGAFKIPYSHIRSFWILHNLPHMNELHIHTNRKVHHDVVIPLLGMDPSLLRQFLVTQIPEWEGKQLSLLDIFIRILRLN